MLLNTELFTDVVTVVRVPTPEEALEFCEALESCGYHWNGGGRLSLYTGFNSGSKLGIDYYLYNKNKTVKKNSWPTYGTPGDRDHPPTFGGPAPKSWTFYALEDVKAVYEPDEMDDVSFADFLGGLTNA